MTFEIEATVRELSDEIAREAPRHFAIADETLGSEGRADAVERQRRLLAAIRADREVFERWMWRQAPMPFEKNETYDEMIGVVGAVPDNDVDLIFRAPRELPAKDGHYFRRAEEAEVLSEHIEELNQCFGSEIVRVRVEGLEGS